MRIIEKRKVERKHPLQFADQPPSVVCIKFEHNSRMYEAICAESGITEADRYKLKGYAQGDVIFLRNSMTGQSVWGCKTGIDTIIMVKIREKEVHRSSLNPDLFGGASSVSAIVDILLLESL